MKNSARQNVMRRELGWRSNSFSGNAWVAVATDFKRLVREKSAPSLNVCGFAFAGDDRDTPTGVLTKSRAGKRHTIDLKDLLERRAK